MSLKDFLIHRIRGWIPEEPKLPKKPPLKTVPRFLEEKPKEFKKLVRKKKL